MPIVASARMAENWLFRRWRFSEHDEHRGEEHGDGQHLRHQEAQDEEPLALERESSRCP